MESGETQTPKKERKGLRKVWKRFKDIFKDKSRTPAPAATATTTIATTTPSTAGLGQSESRKPEPDPEPQPELRSEPSAGQPPFIEVDETAETSPVIVELPAHATPSQRTTAPPDPRDEAQMRFSKAQAIFAKYNLQLNEADWDMRPRQPYERVPKSIRMRVKYTCHNCSATFGHDRVCVGCQHRRCAQCSRYPPKKNRPRQRATDPDPAHDPTGAPRARLESQAGAESGIRQTPNPDRQIGDRGVHEAVTRDQPPDNPVEAKAAEERATTTS